MARTRNALAAVGAVAMCAALVALHSLRAPQLRPAALRQSELADGPVATVAQNEENIVGSLGVVPSAAARRTADGGLLASPDLTANGEVPAAPVSSVAHADRQHGTGLSNSRGRGTDYAHAASAGAELDSYFDSLPVHDVTPDHLPEDSQSAAAAKAARFDNEPSPAEEWDDKLKNLEVAKKIVTTRGDAALEAAVKDGLARAPVGAESAHRELAAPRDVPREIISRMTTATGNRISGVDGLRAAQYKKLVGTVVSGVAKERQIMARLARDIAARKNKETAAEASPAKTDATAEVKKYDDKYLDLNAPGAPHDEFSDFNAPISGEPDVTPYHGANDEEALQVSNAGDVDKGDDAKAAAVDDAEVAVAPAGKAPTQKKGFIGGAGIEGGQGNADSIYGSHDDHDTYGVLGSGWQGPGNGEAPGDLWNPAQGQRYRGVSAGVKAAKGGASGGAPALRDLSGGLAGKVKEISVHMDDERRQLVHAQQVLQETEAVINSALHPDSEQAPAAAGVKKVRRMTALRIKKADDVHADLNSEIPMATPGWQYDNYANFNPAVDAEPALTKAGKLNKAVGFKTWSGPTNSYSPPIQGGRYGTSNEMDATPMSAIFKGNNGAILKASPRQLQQLRIKKADDVHADLNSEIPMATPGWQYDNYANFNPAVDAEPALTKAGKLNKAVGFKTWSGPTNSYSPPIQGGRYGTSNEMDATPMSAIFKSPKATALAMKNDEIAMDIDQKQLRLAETTLADMAGSTLQHHKLWLARAHSPKGPLPKDKVEAWDKRDIARTKKQQQLVDALSDAVQSEQLQLNEAENAMIGMEMVSTRKLAGELAAGKKRSGKDEQAHAVSKSRGHHGSNRLAAVLSGPPGSPPGVMAAAAASVGSAFKGLSDARRVPSRKEMVAARRRGAHTLVMGRGRQQLALKRGGGGGAGNGARSAKKAVTKAGGFGLCAIFGIACS